MKREDYYFGIRIDAQLNTSLPSQKEECPPNSGLNNNVCTCVNGYRPSADSRECRKKFR